MAAKFTTKAITWLEVTMDEAIDFLEANGSAEEKKQFKKWLFTTKDGRTTKKANWGNARKEFLKKYAPDLLPVKKEKAAKKSDRVLNW